MTEPIDLDAVKARAEAATPGPWDHSNDGLVWPPRMGDPVSGSTEIEDAEFIAAARTDVPALVAEVERLRQALAGHLFDGESPSVREAIRSELIVQALDVARECDELVKQRDEARAEVERLQRLLAEARSLIDQLHRLGGHSTLAGAWLQRDTAIQQRDEARAEIGRLRERLDRWESGPPPADTDGGTA